jgi:large subunit ribosomal protein L5e
VLSLSCHQVHEAIRANPVLEKKARSKPADAKRWQPAKLTYEQRKAQLKEKLAALQDADE